MTDDATQSTVIHRTSSRRASKPVALAGLLSAFAAFLAASCCVLPFVFITLGLGGVWLSFLDNGLLYREELQWGSAAVLFIGWIYLLARRQRARTATRLLLAATMLLVASVLVWEYQAAIRGWLMEMR